MCLVITFGSAKGKPGRRKHKLSSSSAAISSVYSFCCSRRAQTVPGQAYVYRTTRNASFLSPFHPETKFLFSQSRLHKPAYFVQPSGARSNVKARCFYSYAGGRDHANRSGAPVSALVLLSPTSSRAFISPTLATTATQPRKTVRPPREVVSFPRRLSVSAPHYDVCCSWEETARELEGKN